MKTLEGQDKKKVKKGNNSSYPYAPIRKSIEEITHLNGFFDPDYFDLFANDEWRPKKLLQTSNSPFKIRKAMKTTGAKGKFRQNLFKDNYLEQ